MLYMIEPEKVLNQVKQENYPASWKVYHGTGNYGYAIVGWIFAAALIW